MSTVHQEYLVGFGRLGDFGRFRAAQPLACRRGDRVVVRSHRGQELGEILGPALPGHAVFLPNSSVGMLLRPANDEDLALSQSRQREQEWFALACQQASSLGLPLEVLDFELLLDGEHGVLHLIRSAPCDIRELVSSLSRQLKLHILVQDLTKTEEPAGCAAGSCGSGSCGSCGSGGCGSCATRPATPPVHDHRYPLA